MYEQVRDFYLSKGFGGRVGFGTTPAIIVIDMAKAWLDESSPLGSRNVQGVMQHILRLLEVGRERRVPIFFTTMAFDPRGVEASGPIGRKLLHSSEGHALGTRRDRSPRTKPAGSWWTARRSFRSWGRPGGRSTGRSTRGDSSGDGSGFFPALGAGRSVRVGPLLEVVQQVAAREDGGNAKRVMVSPSLEPMCATNSIHVRVLMDQRTHNQPRLED